MSVEDGREAMTAAARFHWGRALVGGFLAEVGIFVIVIPILNRYGPRPEQVATPPAALFMTYVATLWVLRKVQSRLVLHGILVGVIATLIYVAISIGQPEPPLFILAHVLKIVGGIAASVVVQRRRARVTTASAWRDPSASGA